MIIALWFNQYTLLKYGRRIRNMNKDFDFYCFLKFFSILKQNFANNTPRITTTMQKKSFRVDRETSCKKLNMFLLMLFGWLTPYVCISCVRISFAGISCACVSCNGISCVNVPCISVSCVGTSRVCISRVNVSYASPPHRGIMQGWRIMQDCHTFVCFTPPTILNSGIIILRVQDWHHCFSRLNSLLFTMFCVEGTT